MAFVILILIQAYWLLFPGPLIIETNESGGQIYFSANRRVVLFPRDCITARWDVENISQVYLNGQPQVGNGETQMCLTDGLPSLEVHFQDGTQGTSVLNVSALSTSPLAYISLALFVLIGLFRWRQLACLAHHPLRLFAAVIVLIAIFYLFVTYLLSLSESTATTDWLTASEATASLITALTLLTFIIALGFGVAQIFFSQPEASELLPAKSWARGWLIASGITLIIVAGMILAINPRGMYLSTAYPPYELILRGTKMAGYEELSQTPDISIMGSSRAFTLPPDYIEEKTGLTAYNMAVEGGRIEDFLIQAQQMTSLPEVLLVEVQEGLPRQPEDIAARAPLNWIPEMSLDTALMTIQKRLTGLFDLHQLAESIYTARYYPLYSRQPAEWPEFEADGFASRPLLSPSELEQAVLLDIGRLPPPHCDGISEQSQADVNQLITLADAHDSALVFYLSPWHPQYQDAILRDDAAYQACYSATVHYLQELAQAHPNLFFLDFSQLDSIDGLDDELGYYDAQHITEENSRRLIDHAADTLIQAYHTALDS